VIAFSPESPVHVTNKEECFDLSLPRKVDLPHDFSACSLCLVCLLTRQVYVWFPGYCFVVQSRNDFPVRRLHHAML
jgi:hypothetical protein